MNELCDQSSLLHTLVMFGVFLFEAWMGKTKFGSTLGLITAPLFRRKDG